MEKVRAAPCQRGIVCALGAPPPLIGERERSCKTRTLRRRGNEVVLFDIVSSPASDAAPTARSNADASATPRLQSRRAQPPAPTGPVNAMTGPVAIIGFE
jgi:hypothetical protein